MYLRIVAALIALFLSTQAYAQKKVALVIGNTKYVTQKPLTNPKNDAVLIASILRDSGFALVQGGPLFDLGLQEHYYALENFGRAAENAEVAVVYYSGHGMQVNGTNYLIPVDAPLVSRNNVSTRFVNANMIIDQFTVAKSRLNILLLDACRDNPLEKGAGGGLAPMQATYGTVIGFATQPGNVASDGPRSGGNSPYATALARAMRVKGLELFDMLRQVAIDVYDSTDKEQQPWMSASPVKGKFYFIPPPIMASSEPSISVSPSINAVVPTSPAPAQPQVQAAVNPTQGAIGTSVSLTTLGYNQLKAERFLEARDTLTKALQLDPESVTAKTYLGFSWLFIGKSEPDPHLRLAMYREPGFRLLDEAVKAVRENPSITENPGAPYRHRAEMIMETAKALLSTDQRINQILDAAIKDLEDSIKADPNAKPGYSREALARAYRLRGDAYNPQVDPNRARSGKYVLDANKARESYYLALKAYDDLLAFNYKYAAGYEGRCYVNMRLGRGEAVARPDAIEAKNRNSDYKSMQCLNPVQPWGQVAMRSAR